MARFGLPVGTALALLVAIAPIDGLPREGRMVLALLALMAVLWITEAIPLAATALLPIVALPLLGIDVALKGGALLCADAACPALPSDAVVRTLTLGDLGAHYANPIVLLYIGGFLLGIAIERWGLSKRIAFGVVARAGDDPKLMLAGFIAAAAFLSMWISNTSTSLILTPLAMSVAAGAATGGGDKKLGAALALGVAYAATIGGLSTPIGTPTNGIALQQLRAQGLDVSFGAWMLVALPVALVLLPVAWFILGRDLRVDQTAAQAARAEVSAALARLGPMSAPEMRVAFVFVLMAVAWAFSGPIASALEPVVGGRVPSGHVDTIIATTGALILFAAPAGGGERRPLLIWADAEKIPWGILLLFGGGLALAAAAELSGLSQWLAQALSGLSALDPRLLVLLIGVVVIVITEFASNIATISVMGPVLLALAGAHEALSPAAFIIPAAMAASMGFAMPVGSASNAIAYATGAVRQSDMIRRGLMMNVAALVAVTIAGLTLAPWVLG